MAIAAERATPAVETTETEAAGGFSSERLKAPFLLRCAALFVDYMVLLAVPVIWLVVGKFVLDSGTVVISPWVWTIGAFLFLSNFIFYPMLRGKTLGKALLGLTIVNMDGSRLTLFGTLKRNLMGYLLTILTGGIGFLIAAVNSSGRSLHDFVAGTVVVRGRRSLN